MKQAYRQIPLLLDSQTSLAVTAITTRISNNPSCTKFMVSHSERGIPSQISIGLPIEWLNRVMIRAYKVMLDHSFDDFYYVERPACGKVTMFCLQQAFQLLGFSLDSEKTQVPSKVAYVQGVAFNTRVLHSERHLKVEPKPLRVQNFTVLIDAILRREAPSSVAASVLGKFVFLWEARQVLHSGFAGKAIFQYQFDTSHSRDYSIPEADETCGANSPPPSLPAGPTTSPHYSP